ncbi:hypothetical protein L873DRAFT_1723181, partial [Choiromyces venosus 120613-1]
FFQNYQNALAKYGNNRAKYIYNMDESGIRIGRPTGETLIVPSEVKDLYTASPENCKSLTIIEAICADGSDPPPPVIISSGEKIMESWVHENLTGAEVITVSPTGYTNETIALAWLNHFINHVGAGPDQHWLILLLDGHITRRQDDFIIKCHENHIVPFEFPSYLRHILQSLDVGVFCSWKHYHNKAINHALHSLEIEYTISFFFRDLGSIREQTFQPHTIKNLFKDSGMFPVSYKAALKKMGYYNNKAKHTIRESVGLRDSSEAASSEHEVSVQHDGDLELPTPSSSYFQSQKGLAE